MERNHYLHRQNVHRRRQQSHLRSSSSSSGSSAITRISSAASKVSAPSTEPEVAKPNLKSSGPSVLEQRLKVTKSKPSFAERRARYAEMNKRKQTQVTHNELAAAAASAQKALAEVKKQETIIAAAPPDEFVGEELGAFRERTAQLHQQAEERSAGMSKALSEFYKWILEADPSNAIDEEHAAEIGAEPPPPDDGLGSDQRKLTKRFSQGDNTAARAKARQGSSVQIEPGRVLGRQSSDGDGGGDGSGGGGGGGGGDAMGERPQTPFDMDALTTKLRRGREVLDRVHGQMVESVHIAVQQRDSALHQSARVGSSLSERVASMDQELGQVLAAIEEGELAREMALNRAQRAEGSATRLEEQLNTVKAQLEAANKRVKGLKKLIEENGLREPGDGETPRPPEPPRPLASPQAEENGKGTDGPSQAELDEAKEAASLAAIARDALQAELEAARSELQQLRDDAARWQAERVAGDGARGEELAALRARRGGRGRGGQAKAGDGEQQKGMVRGDGEGGRGGGDEAGGG